MKNYPSFSEYDNTRYTKPSYRMLIFDIVASIGNT